MKTILDIIQRAGGWHPGLCFKIKNPPYRDLVIEAIDESGPCGLPAISVCRYSEVDGDLMRDPEMRFELGSTEGAHLTVFCYCNDFLGVEQWSRLLRDGNYCFHPRWFEQQEEMATLWDKALEQQRFAAVFDPKKHICG